MIIEAFFPRVKEWFSDDNITINVLSRLNAKTLHFLKYVSREWLDLILDRTFVRFQLKKSEPVSGFFFQEVFQWADDDIKVINYIPIEGENVKLRSNVLDFLPESVVILSSNNGLICCRSCFPTPMPIIYICNPLNKEWKPVKWPNIPKSSSLVLAFDPFLNPIDTSTDFILVAVSSGSSSPTEEVQEEDEEEESLFFDIYSSQKRLWKRSNECCKCNHKLTKSKGILVEGILYWLTDGNQIIMFDPQNELSWLITAPLPAVQLSSEPEMCIGESNGNLLYILLSEHGLQQWVLDDCFSSQWSLKSSISLEELEKKNSDVLYDIQKKVGGRVNKDRFAWIVPLALKDGMLLLRVSTDLYLYHFENGRMVLLCDAATMKPKSLYSPIVVPYVMSLVPLYDAY